MDLRSRSSLRPDQDPIPTQLFHLESSLSSGLSTSSKSPPTFHTGSSPSSSPTDNPRICRRVHRSVRQASRHSRPRGRPCPPGSSIRPVGLSRARTRHRAAGSIPSDRLRARDPAVRRPPAPKPAGRRVLVTFLAVVYFKDVAVSWRRNRSVGNDWIANAIVRSAQVAVDIGAGQGVSWRAAR